MRKTILALCTTVAVSSALSSSACTEDASGEHDATLQVDASHPEPKTALDAATHVDATAGLDAGASCKLDQRYRFTSGSLLSSVEFELTPDGHLRRSERVRDGGSHCEQARLSCDQVNAVAASLRDPDVLAAYSPELVLYGRDFSVVSDATSVRFTRADGQGFEVGESCGGTPECREPPVGLRKLVGLLGQLRSASLTEACSGG